MTPMPRRRPPANPAARPAPFLRQPFAHDFVELIRDHSAVIDAGFAGHIHHDDFRLVMSRRGQAVAAEKIAPGISPIFGQNPGFHLFTYDRLTGRPTDYSTHYLANLAAGIAAHDGRWEKSTASPAATVSVAIRRRRSPICGAACSATARPNEPSGPFTMSAAGNCAMKCSRPMPAP